MNRDKLLRFSAIVLSATVLVQAYLATRFIQQRHNALLQKDVYFQDYNPQPPSESPLSSVMWLEPGQPGPGTRTLTLWLESSKEVSSAFAVLSYNPELLEIVDREPNRPGLQLTEGQADSYPVHKVDAHSGRIELLGSFDRPVSGKVMLASLAIRKKTDNVVSLPFEYVARSRESSYVSSYQTGENVLEQPGVVSF